MPGKERNLEVKAIDPDPQATLHAALEFGAADQGMVLQRDTYFHAVGPKVSRYRIVPVADDLALLLWRNVRIHLDASSGPRPRRPADMSGLAGKTIIMSGGSRGTIYSAATEIEAAGGQSLPIVGDVRDDAVVADAVERTFECFGASTSSSDAGHHILTRPAHMTTGNFFIDDEVLAEAGVTDLSGYAYVPDADLQVDLFLDG